MAKGILNIGGGIVSVDASGNFTVDTGLIADGTSVFNETGVAVDFRIESDDNVNMFFVDGSEDRVGIGVATPASALDVRGTVQVGENGTGHDVVFYGATTSANMTWDENVDDLILSGVAGLIVPDGKFTLGSTAVTSTAAELNLIDGGTARGTTAVVSGDGILVNDGGVMRMTNVDTVSTYFASHTVGGGNIVTTGALNSGSITSGFGTIDTGTSTITTTGLISGGSLDIDNVLINGTTIGHTDDTDLLTLADGKVTVAGELQATTLDIGGTNITSTAAELNLLDGVSGLIQADLTKLAAVDATAAELNLIDGGTSRGTTALASGDGILINDGGTMAMTNVDTVSTYFAGHSVGGTNMVTTGALNAGSITSGFGTIDTGTSTITTTGLISGGSLDIDNVLINGTTIGHTNDTDLLTLASGALTLLGTLTVGVNDTGHDVTFYGATALRKVMWDESADELLVHGKISQRFGSAFKNQTHASWVMGG